MFSFKSEKITVKQVEGDSPKYGPLINGRYSPAHDLNLNLTLVNVEEGELKLASRNI